MSSTKEKNKESQRDLLVTFKRYRLFKINKSAKNTCQDQNKYLILQPIYEHIALMCPIINNVNRYKYKTIG